MFISKSCSIKQAGPADIMCILKLPAGTFHVTFFEEHPFPDRVKPVEERKIIRLKSKMHHIKGVRTFECAKKRAEEFRKKIFLPYENVITDRVIAVSDPVPVWLLPNWLKDGYSLKEALAKVIALDTREAR